MNKLLLAIWLIPFSGLAAEIDLTQDAMYFCKSNAVAGIIKGKSEAFSTGAESTWTLKIKEGNLMFESTNAKIDSTHKGVFSLFKESIYLATLNGSLFVEKSNNNIIYTVNFVKFPTVQKATSIIMQGTCTKW